MPQMTPRRAQFKQSTSYRCAEAECCLTISAPPADISKYIKHFPEKAGRPAFSVGAPHLHAHHYAGGRVSRGPYTDARLRGRRWRRSREELASGLSDVLFMQQIIRKANHGASKNPLFRCVIVSVRAFCHCREW